MPTYIVKIPERHYSYFKTTAETAEAALEDVYDNLEEHVFTELSHAEDSEFWTVIYLPVDTTEQDLIEIAEAITKFFCGDTEKAKLWWETENSAFGGIIPTQMLELGKSDKLFRWIRESLAGNERPNQNVTVRPEDYRALKILNAQKPEKEEE